MKVTCNVIRDLLPLYADGVCSGESRELVEAHLRTCASCRNELKMTEDAYNSGLPHPNDEKMAEAAANGWKKAKKRYLLVVMSAIIMAMAAVCLIICARQTAYLVSVRDVFGAAHPDYVGHSWRLLALLLAPALLAGSQTVLLHRRGMAPASQVLCCVLSAAMLVPEGMALGAAFTQHYNMAMLVSDYGLRLPFDGGWLLLLLVAALLAVTAAQLLTVIFSALAKYDSV